MLELGRQKKFKLVSEEDYKKKKENISYLEEGINLDSRTNEMRELFNKKGFKF